MSTQLTFFNSDETVAFVRNDAISAVHYQDKYYLEASFDMDDEKPISDGMYVGYMDREGDFNLFIIEMPSIDYVDKSVSFQANLAAMVELQDYIIEDRRPSSCQAGLAVSVALENTEWSLGTAEDTGIGSNLFYYQTPWEALLKIAEKYGCDYRFRVSLTDAGITGRYIDVVNDIGRDVGLRLEVGKNLNSLIVEIDDTTVRTAMYGRGKGEEVGVNANGDATYGRRIGFEDLEWSVTNGDPCDKPTGQKYIEDKEATKLYGRKGRPRFGVVVFEDCEDEEELIKLTWDYLQIVKSPKVTVKTSIRILEKYFGYSGEAIRYRDHAIVILDDYNYVNARIATAAVDLVDEGRTEVTIGNAVTSIAEMQASNTQKIQNATEQIKIGSSVVVKNPDLMKGIINTMVTQIISSGTKMYTDPKDGSFIYESDDGTSAVKLTGSGILIANEKENGEFKWSTAIDGSGMSASVINSGVLNASIVKILGTERFYWDSQAIFIIDTEDANKQIRIGVYDGKNYGIGYTQDGGQTWQNAIGFNGIVLGTGTVTKENLSKDVLDSMTSGRGIDSIEEYYLASDLETGVTIETDGWTKDVQSTTNDKRFLWNYQIIHYTDQTDYTSQPKIISRHSVGISGIENMYGTSADLKTKPTEWITSPPEMKGDDLYLWNYEIIHYSDGSKFESDPCVIGYRGDEEISIGSEEPDTDVLWLDTSTTPPTLKQHNGEEWVECTVSRNELDNISQRISEHDAQFILVEDQISAKVSQTDYATDMAGKANHSDVQAQFDAAAELNAKNLLLKFSEATKYTDDKTDTFNSFMELVEMYFKFGVDGLELGKIGNKFKTIITNEKMSFTQDDEEVAFISNNRLHITEARVTDRLSIGTEDNGYFDWVTTSDGLGLKWR